MSDITRRGFLSLFTKTAALLAVAPLVLPKLALAEPQVVRRESGIYVVSEKEPLKQPGANVPLGHRLVGRSGTITFSRDGEVHVIEPYQAAIDIHRDLLITGGYGLAHSRGWAESFVSGRTPVKALLDGLLLAHRENQGPWDFSYAAVDMGRIAVTYFGKVLVTAVTWSGMQFEPTKVRIEWVFDGKVVRA